MIPTAILLGLVGGAIPRFRWWSLPAVGVIWSLMLMVEGDPSMSVLEIWIEGLALGAANGAVGVLVSWGLLNLIQAALRRDRNHATDH